MAGCSGGTLVGGGREESISEGKTDGRRGGWRLEDEEVGMALITGREDTEAATSSEGSWVTGFKLAEE